MLMPNVAALTQIPAQEGLTALVAMSPENFIYVSGANIETTHYLRPRQAFAVIPAAADPFLLVCTMEQSQTVEESWVRDVRGYTEFVHDPVGRLAEELQAAGLTNGRMGLDMDFIPAADFQRLSGLLPNVDFINTTEVVARVRAIKTADEVSRLEYAARQTHRAVLDALEESTLGDTERDIANRIGCNIINYGAENLLFLYFASGARTIHPHAYAQHDRIPKEGDIIRLDVGGTYGQLSSDFARTYSAGSPTLAQRQIYAALVTAEENTIAAARPGMTAEDLFFVCRDEFVKNGLVFHMPHVGHSFGVELHENPMLRPGNKTVLQAGMVLNVEPGVRDDAGSLYHTEDLILITEGGSRLLTLGLAPKELPVLGQKIA